MLPCFLNKSNYCGPSKDSGFWRFPQASRSLSYGGSELREGLACNPGWLYLPTEKAHASSYFCSLGRAVMTTFSEPFRSHALVSVLLRNKKKKSVSSFLGSGGFWGGKEERGRLNSGPAQTLQPQSSRKKPSLAKHSHSALSLSPKCLQDWAFHCDRVSSVSLGTQTHL